MQGQGRYAFFRVYLEYNLTLIVAIIVWTMNVTGFLFQNY